MRSLFLAAVIVAAPGAALAQDAAAGEKTFAQCRACHLVSEDTWNMKHRKTIFPADVARNRYTAHERRFLKDNPELAKGSK